LVVSEVFPPVVGGSGVLLENVYARVGGGNVTALVEESIRPRPVSNGGRIAVVPTRIAGDAWGLFDPRRWPHQVHLASKIYRRAAYGRAIVHCGRAQPEAVPALMASMMPAGPRYLFWVHGEDIAAAMSSRQYASTMRLVYRRASAVIANSKNTARMIESLSWHRGQVHIVYPGVDADRFHPGADDGCLRRRLAPNGELLLLSVSRLQKRKGHALVLKALPALMEHVPGVRYVIVGSGGERESLLKLSAALGLDEVVRFEGEVSDNTLQAYFAAADIFVLPTRVEPTDFEGFGIVYLEAAAAGKAAIGGRNGGVPEAISDGETGLLVGGDDAAELARALRSLCEDHELRQRLGRAARARVLREFTWERAAAQVTEIHTTLATAG
jgi:phosphatidylinositol alpha-1,6-mannosyltransferase